MTTVIEQAPTIDRATLLPDAQRIGQALTILIDMGMLPPAGSHTTGSLTRTIEQNTNLMLPDASGRLSCALLADILDTLAPINPRWRRANRDLQEALPGARWAGRSLVPTPDETAADAAAREALLAEWETDSKDLDQDGPRMTPRPCAPPVRALGASA